MRLLASIVCIVLLAGLAWGQSDEVPSLDKLVNPELKSPEGLQAFELRLAVRPTVTYLATLDANPGVVLKIVGGAEQLVYKRPQGGKLTSFDFGPWIWAPDPPRTVLYFCDSTGDHRIHYALGLMHDAALCVAPFTVREVDFGPGNCLYVSEAYDAAADGRIWKLSPGHPPTIFYTVRRAQVAGRWSGHFAFDPTGRLFISNGSAPMANIWSCPLAGVPSRVFHSTGPILGFHFVGPQTVLFTNGTPLLRKVTFGGAPSVVFTSPAHHRYCDVHVR